MIDCVYYNDDIRCYRDGRVERLWTRQGWKGIDIINHTNGYNLVRVIGKNILRHRLIAFCFLGLDNIVGNNVGINIIDHIDGVKLNNAVNNLRITNGNGNQHNRREVKGYTFIIKTQKYCSKIKANGKHINLGYYETEEEAHQAYLEGKRKYHLW